MPTTPWIMAANRLFTCLVFCTAFFTPATAQRAPHFIEKLTTGEGLSSDKVHDLVQDDNGFLWIATSDGLNRFDGTEMVQYFHQDSAGRRPGAGDDYDATGSLPHNYIYCLKKMPGNYLAIGTQGGLSWYNGNTGRFRNFFYRRNKETDALDEYNNTIISMELDVKGNLWVASRNCLYVFDPQRNLQKVFLSPFTNEDAVRRRLRYVEKMIPLSEGPVLLYLYDGWYTCTPASQSPARVKSSPFTEISARLAAPRMPPATHPTCQNFPASRIFKLFDRYLLCIPPDEDSLVLIDEKGRRLSACSFPFNKYPYVLWSQKVTMVDSSRLLLLYHNFGLGIVPITWKDGTPAIHGPSPLLFETTEFENALCDRQGNWWLATTGEGLEKISPRKQAFTADKLVTGSPEGRVSYEAVNTTRYGNNLWIASYGDGFFKTDLLSGRQQQYRLHGTSDDIWSNFIWSVRQVSADTLWVGTQAGLFWYCISRGRCGHIEAYPGKPPALDSVPITTQFADSHGLIWLGLGKGRGVCYFDTRDHRFTYYPGNSPAYPLRYPLVIAEDKKGNCWFTNDASGRLLCWERSTGRFREIPLPASFSKQTSDLYGIYCESDTLVWLGSVTGGLIKFDVPGRRITRYGHDKGLVNSHISSIYRDSAERLWLVTEGGLACFDPRAEIFVNYSENDGLPVKYPTAFFFYDSLDRRLYSGGKGAVFYFEPGSMNTCLPPRNTLITALQVNGRPYLPEQDMPAAFSAEQNDITVHYTTIDLDGGPRSQYVYRLIGEDSAWIVAGNQRQINFSHLPPGHYTFMVYSQNQGRGGGDRREASWHFYIRPPFTSTGWFYGLVVVVTGALFYLLYRFRRQQLMHTEQMRNEISRNLHDEVGSTLTNISLGSLLAQRQLKNGDPAGLLKNDGPVNRLLERIYQDSQTVSQTMREIVWSINPGIDTLGEALPCMLQYASEMLEAKNIELNAEIDPAIEHIRLTMQRRRDLYLIFKEAVNNLARHSNAAHARIRFYLAEGTLIMTIADDGAGFDRAIPFMSNGLKNMKERAASHRWKLVIQSGSGSGTTLTVKAVIA